MKRKDKKRRLAKALVVLMSFIVVSLLISLPNPVKAASLWQVVSDPLGALLSVGASALGNIFFSAINLLLLAVYGLVSVLLVIAGMLMDWAVNPVNFMVVVNNEAVLYGWKIVRDFLNIAFILVLLYSAFCTIFQIEKYHLKKILLMVVLMALLVNFSFPVARFIIDTANVLMYYILGMAFPDLTNSSGFSGNLAAMSRVVNMSMPEGSSGDVVYTTKLIMAIIFIFLFAITLLVIGALLVIRIVVLAILIMFAPIGFVGAIFPSTKGYADSWWTMLFKQSFFGPIIVFMLYLALIMMDAMNKKGLEGSIKKVVSSSTTPTSAYSDVITSGTYMIIPVVILWCGLIAAQKMGAAGADIVVGKAKKIAGWPARMLGKGARYAAVSGLKKFERDVLGRKYSPRAFIQGWKRRAEEVERRFMEPAAGGWHDRLNKIWSLGKEKTSFRLGAMQSNILKEQKRLAEVSQEVSFLKPEYESALERKDYQKAAAILRIMFNNNDQNEFMKQIKEKAVGPESMKNIIFEDLTKAGMNEEDAAKQLMDLSEVAFAKGNYGNYGMATFDGKRFRRTSLAEQKNATAGKLVNLESQAKFRTWHWNSFLTENTDSTPGALHGIGKNLLGKLTAADIKQVHRARTDFINNMFVKLPEIRKHAAKVGETGDRMQQRIIEEFANEIEKTKYKEYVKDLGAGEAARGATGKGGLTKESIEAADRKMREEQETREEEEKRRKAEEEMDEE